MTPGPLLSGRTIVDIARIVAVMDTESRPFSRADVIIAVALTVAMALAALVTGPNAALLRVGGAVVGIALVVIAARRRRPFTTAVVVTAVVVVEVVLAPDGSQAPAFVALMVAAYSLGAHARPVPLAAGVITCTGGVAVAQVLAPAAGYSHASAISFFAAVLIVAPAAVGLLVRAQRWLAGRVRASTETIRKRSAARIADERAAQGLRVTADIESLVLAGLERIRPHADVRDLADVTALRDLGRDVLARMRGLLGELRHGNDEPASSLLPGRQLDELQIQVRRVLAAGEPAGEPVRPAHLRWMLISTARLDLLLTTVAGVYALIVISTNVHASRPLLAMTVGAVAVLPIARIRRRPVPAVVAGVVMSTAYAALAVPSDPLDGWVIAGVLIAYPLLVCAVGRRRAALIGLSMCVLGAMLAWAFDGPGTVTWSDVAGSAVLIAGSGIAGRVLHATASALAFDARVGALADERHHDGMRAALEADRTHVAQDLHDAVGHTMTGIVLQATAAVRVWDSNPDLATEHVRQLRTTLAEALDDLRPLVATLAIDGGRPSRLDGVPDLVNRARVCGLRPSIRVEGALGPVGAAHEAIVYRIVQEALTNASRYAPGARVDLRIVHADGTVGVEIANGAPPYPTAEPLGSGHGLRGMAERVNGCGGTLEAGPTPDGGFRVHATLPLATSPDGVLK